jgi:hypothetical protein
MKYWKTLALLAVISLVFTACDDNTTTPTPTEDNYYPVAVGNYWIYDSYVVDKDGTEATEISNSDSVYVVAAEENATQAYTTYTINTDMNYNKADEMTQDVNLFRFSDDKKLHADILYLFPQTHPLLNTIKSMIGTQISNIGYVQIADFKAIEPWILLPEFTMDTLTLAGYQVKDITYTINGEHEAQQTIDVNGTNYACEVMAITHKLKGKVTVTGLGDVPVEINIKIDNYYAKDMGLVRKSVNPVSIPLGITSFQLSTGTNTYYRRGNHITVRQ